MLAKTSAGGLCIAFPDVCMTPPAAIPIPYPNMGLGPMAVPAAYNVLSFYAPTHNLFSTIPLTLGDQPGVMLGVASGLVMAPSRRVTGAFTCLVGYAPVQRMTSFGPQNNTNAPGVRLVPSQPKVIVLSP